MSSNSSSSESESSKERFDRKCISVANVEPDVLGVEDAGADLVHGADLANWAADLVDVEDAGADAVHGAGLVDLEDL